MVKHHMKSYMAIFMIISCKQRSGFLHFIMKTSLMCRSKVSFIDLNVVNNLFFDRFLMNVGHSTKNIEAVVNCIAV